MTDVNFESSKDVLKTVLTELSHVQPSWESVINSLLEQENIDIAKAIHLEHNNSNDNNCHSEGFCVNGDVDGVDDDDTAEDNILAVQLNLQVQLFFVRLIEIVIEKPPLWLPTQATHIITPPSQPYETVIS